jgi:hypothetical protein
MTRLDEPDTLGRVVLHHARPDALRPTLLATGRWVEDPLPDLRQRQKPWVTWSVRERQPGVGLHVEREADVLRAHLDFFSPGDQLWRLPAHVVIDLWGWSTLRMWLLRFRGAR